MTHFRTQLRTQVKSILDTALSADSANVYINRVAVLEELKLPIVTITTDLDRRRPVDIHSDYDADVSLTITVYEKDISGVDTALDALCAKIENALQDNATLDAVVELQETGTDFVDADKIVGQAQMNYLVTINGIADAETVI